MALYYILGVPISWWSKQQKSVLISSSEVEYVALSEAVKEVMFVIQLLGRLKKAVKYWVMVRVDNVVAIFMASNITNICHTKHMYIRYKYVNEYFEDWVVEIVLVKSAENDNDVLIKNLSGDVGDKPWDVLSLKNIWS